MTSTFDRVLDELGAAVVTGAHPAWERRSIDQLVERTGASRSIVREAVRVLVGLGLLTARRRVGVVAVPIGMWDVSDPRVVGWRLAGPDRGQVLDELHALRRAIEPAAAAAAAERASDASCQDRLEALLAAADRLAAATGPDDAAAFLQADRELHRRILAMSGNALFRHLGGVVDRALDERAGIGPDLHDIGLHVTVARAIAAGDASAASAAMREIIDRV
ncbi:DNA-binding transcriptional regulator, FadR family [Curtobacterium sp. 314Chir4.1]|uniref:FadR/GntR family transcriptional regulator n=1 Tax=Curtobacterium sp. 314Chir4.1 TaxID=1279028 RepID=UPI000BCCBD56|nr:FCD domain-containing protein [Curtobacterium sp. 314Chir4.1]SOC89564.1 DNA-binding transcriptional regulator, FadR family [Curtobacterium sp. 314Chir4.1]